MTGGQYSTRVASLESCRGGNVCVLCVHVQSAPVKAMRTPMRQAHACRGMSFGEWAAHARAHMRRASDVESPALLHHYVCVNV